MEPKNLSKEQELADKYCIFKCTAGSHAYGTAIPGVSDIDTRSIFIAPPEYILSCVNSIEQVESSEEDATSFELRKFMKLAAECNPNIIELLFTDDKNVQFLDWPMKMLRDNRHLFLSKKAKFTFSGYSMSQLNRIRGHHKWITQEVKAVEKLRALYAEGKISLEWLQKNFTESTCQKLANTECNTIGHVFTDHMDNYLQDQEIQLISTLPPHLSNFCKYIDMTGNIYDDGVQIRRISPFYFLAETFGQSIFRVYYSPEFFKEKLGFFSKEGLQLRYIDATQDVLDDKAEFAGTLVVNIEELKKNHKNWKQYWDWKNHRNETRAALEEKFKFDTKHAMHLVRLLKMCQEILTEGVVRVHRPDAQELLDIRNGKFDYEWLIKWAEETDQSLNAAYEASTLQYSADYAAIDALYREIVLKYWAEKRLLSI